MMRVNPVGWVLVAFFLIAGIVFTVIKPEGEASLGPIWIGVSLVLLAFYLWTTRKAGKAAQLKREGIPGQAQVLEMTQTGTYVNEQPRVRLKLRIEGPGVTPFEAEDTYTVGLIFLGMLAPGRELPVYIDREDHARFTIDWGGTGATPATFSHEGGPPIDLNANPAAREAVFETLRRHGIDTRGEVDLRQHPAARAAVLEALERHGVDVAHGVAAAAPTTPVEDPGRPLDRLQKLMELKNAQLITDEEFQRQKARIIEGI